MILSTTEGSESYYCAALLAFLEYHNRGFHRRKWEQAYRASVTKLVLLTGEDLPQDSSHDLSATRLGQVGYDVHRLGRREWADTLPHLQDELLAQGICSLVAVLDSHKRVDGLACELILHTDDCRLRHARVLDEGGLNLCCG